MVDEQENKEQLHVRVPSGVKTYLEGKAQELGFKTTNGYINAIFKAIIEDDNGI